MKTVTLYEFSSPNRDDAQLINRVYNELKRVNKKIKIFEYDWEELKATNYVGVLTVKNINIQILPKLYREQEDEEANIEEATKNLLFMLAYTKKLKIKEAGISMLKKEKYSLYEVIIYLFAKNLMNLLKRNYRRDYQKREERLEYIKGKILVNKQLRLPTQEKTWCSYYEYTENNLLNKILKYVSYLLSRTVKSRENWLLLQNILAIFNEVELKTISPSEFDEVPINRLNEEYMPYLNLAKLFLENMTVELQSSRFKTFSLIFDMNILFEEFIGEILRRYKSKILSGTELRDCDIYLQANNVKKQWLVTEPEQMFMLIPDIIFKRGKIELIVDTKYKLLDLGAEHLGVSQSDIYQMFAYGKKYGCRKIILLYPWTEKLGDKKGIIREYTFEDDFKLYIASINLKRDLRKELNNFIEELTEILSLRYEK